VKGKPTMCQSIWLAMWCK